MKIRLIFTLRSLAQAIYGEPEEFLNSLSGMVRFIFLRLKGYAGQTRRFNSVTLKACERMESLMRIRLTVLFLLLASATYAQKSPNAFGTYPYKAQEIRKSDAWINSGR